MKVLITTVPFGDKNRLPLDLLKKSNIEYIINPLNKKLNEEELIKMIVDFDAIIAGTEKISEKVLNKANKLKHISRVGIGLDSVDLLAAEKKGIKVSYTPDVPAPAIAELTIGMMLTLLRSTHVSNSKMHNGEWYRVFGKRLSNVTIGLIGVGRVGIRVIKHLQGFDSPNILANDLSKSVKELDLPVQWVDKEKIFKEADVITLHLPLTSLTKNLIKQEHLILMKKDAIIINTSRGGIINENDLYNVMKSGHLSGAAVDVYEKEPYSGPLKEIERCLMTSHIGSMSIDCRTKMEIEATEEAIRFLSGELLQREVPKEEYDIQRKGL
ncbi:phosphoglycerate dehydrogenase [Candidatus Pelagibacter sp.]|nr:phosphoglycerate dehydrogenase [Candidatus Pelagibacter sp.]